MQASIHYSHGRMAYTGRIPRAAFNAWADLADARPALDAVAAGIRFAPWGRRRAARHRLWRQVNTAARTQAVVAGVQREADTYLARLDTLVYANDLPRLALHLRRLVVVPRVLANADAYRRIEALLASQSALAAIEGGHALHDWLSLTLVDSIAAAVAAAHPSPYRPAPAGNGWITVGVNERFDWRMPLGAAAWLGHYYVLERTRMPMTRGVRKAAAEAIERLESSLSSLSRSQRQEILRRAASSLVEMAVRV